LAYLAFTSSDLDLWPGENWNFVYGQANLRDRTGVWSIYRNGDPAKEAEYQLCLARTLRTASHETGHILTMQHCTAFQCNMNGVNHQAEGDSKPQHLCPVCLRKLCWNLQVEPLGYAKTLRDFSQKHGFAEEAEWYAAVILTLRAGK
jgi:archaemetzincin